MIGRGIILVIGAACLVGAIAAGRAGAPVPAIIWLAGIGIIFAIGGAFEYGASRLSNQRPGPGWIETEERFVDQESGEIVTVFYKPDTGERSYVRSDR
jgi:hypothetical protein